MIPGIHNTAFRQIYDTTHPKVYHFILKLTWNNKDLTHDIVQETYIRLWNTVETPDEQVNYLPLLYTISRNLLVNTHKKMLADRRKNMEWLRAQTEDAGNEEPDIYLRHKASNEALEKMLSQMPERRKKIYLLCKEEGMSHKEIASLLKISNDTVEQQMNLCMKHLRREYAKHLMLYTLIFISMLPV